MGKTRHILLSVGVRTDEAPHQYHWCTRCGAVKRWELPSDVDESNRQIKDFIRAHTHCPQSEMNKLGYGKIHDEHVWMGMIGVPSIAIAAFRAATGHNQLNDNYVAPSYNSVLAEEVVHKIIAMHLPKEREVIEWFNENYGSILGYTKEQLVNYEKIWYGIRVRIFIRVILTLIK